MRDGSGNYDLPGADLTNGTLADADEVMAKLNDIATALTGSLAKDGQTTPTANLPMGGFGHTGVAVAASRTMYARASQIADGSLTYGGVAGGTANAITIAPSPAITAYVLGQRFFFITGASANTSTVKVDVNSVGDGPLKLPDGSAMADGDLPANAAVEIGVVDISTPTEPTFHLLSVNGALLKRSGGTMTGLLTLSGNPTLALHAAPKQYVDLGARGDRQLIWGLTYANNAGDATNDIDIAAGGCMDATGAYWIVLSAITKRLDANWAVGTNQGGLDTGAIANGDYYIWDIARSDTGVTDALFSLSATAPTMPASYDYKRRIGWFKRSGGAIVAFTTYETAGGGLEFLWTVPTLDVNLANTLTTSNRTDAVRVPLDFSVTAILSVSLYDATSSAQAWIFCPDQTGAAPSISAAPLFNVGSTAAFQPGSQMSVRTSATGTIGARANLATVDTYLVSTMGFTSSRR